MRRARSARPAAHRHRPADLLLRPSQPMAARHQREHQRAAAPVLPQRHRPEQAQRRRARRRRPGSQHPPPQDPRMEDSRRGPRRAPRLRLTAWCCFDPLNLISSHPGHSPAECSTRAWSPRWARSATATTTRSSSRSGPGCAGRAPRPQTLEDPGRTRQRDLRVPRDLPQPSAPPLSARHAHPRRVRGSTRQQPSSMRIQRTDSTKPRAPYALYRTHRASATGACPTGRSAVQPGVRTFACEPNGWGPCHRFQGPGQLPASCLRHGRRAPPPPCRPRLARTDRHPRGGPRHDGRRRPRRDMASRRGRPPPPSLPFGRNSRFLVARRTTRRNCSCPVRVLNMSMWDNSWRYPGRCPGEDLGRVVGVEGGPSDLLLRYRRRSTRSPKLLAAPSNSVTGRAGRSGCGPLPSRGSRHRRCPRSRSRRKGCCRSRWPPPPRSRPR
jgi:hypothetical protein